MWGRSLCSCDSICRVVEIPKTSLTQQCLKYLILASIFHAVLSQAVFYFIRGREHYCKEFLDVKDPDCSFHKYTIEQARACLRPKPPRTQTRIQFIGDSHMRMLLTSLMQQAGCYSGTLARHQDSTTACPSINSFFTVHFRTAVNISSLIDSTKFKGIHTDLIVANGVLHPIQNNGSDQNALQYRKDLTSLAVKLDQLAESTPVLWYFQPPIIEERRRNTQKITNKSVNRYNQIVKEVLSPSRVHVWYTARERAWDDLNLYPDAVHIGGKTKASYVQHILNYLCNKDFDFSDGQCCKQKPHFASFNSIDLQFAIHLGLLVLLILSWFAFKFIFTFWNDSTNTKQEPLNLRVEPSIIWTILDSITRIVGILAFAYMVARTPIIPKYEKEFKISEIWFFAILFILFEHHWKRSEVASSKNDLDTRETCGLLITLVVLLEWTKLPLPAFAGDLSSNLLSLALMTAGTDFFLMTRLKKTVSNLVLTIVKLSFLTTILSHILLQSLQDYPLILLLILNMLIGSLPLMLASLPCIKGNSNLYSQFLRFLMAPSILIVNAAIYYHRANFFESAIWNRLFRSRDNTIYEWMNYYRRNAFSFCGGMVIGFVHDEGKPFIDNWLKNAKKRNLVVFFCFLFSVVLMLVHHSPKYNFDFPTLKYTILMSCYFLLRATLLQVKEVYSGFLVWVGEYWVEIYLLYKNVCMPFDGQASLLLFPFNDYVNSVMVLALLVISSSTLYESFQRIVQRIISQEE